MIKKIASILGTVSLICFSFYYTDSAIDVIRKSDPIMKEIVEYSNNYEDSVIESKKINNNIIPGVTGTKVNIDESYNRMKQVGKFDENLIVFETVAPTNSLENDYDNYVISGSPVINNVSIIVKANNKLYIEEILTILNKKDVKVTFFLPTSLFENSLELIKTVASNGHNIELLDDNYNQSIIKKYNNIKKITLGSSLDYCYTETKNTRLLENCSNEKKHTIIPGIISEYNLYNDVKNELENGSIISISNNQHTMRELPVVINYIKQKGKNIVTLENLLKE